MHPVLFRIGPFALHTYGLLIATGFLVGLYLIQRDAKRRGLNPQLIGDMAFWTLLVAIAGARLRFILMFPHDFSWRDPLGWIAIWKGGLVFGGGLIAALIFCFWFIRHNRMDFGMTADTVVPFLPLGHAIGRLGCFFGVGCCYGKVTTMPWGVRFPRYPWNTALPATGSEPYLNAYGPHGTEHWSPPVHPTQLYAFGFLMIIFVVLLVLRKRWHPFSGFTLPAYMILYGVQRFIVEIYRGDHNPVHIANLSDQQVFCIVSIVIGLGVFGYVFLRRKHAAVQVH